MIRAAACVALALGLAGELAAQGVTVSGVVRDSATNRPLSGAIIQLAGSTRQYSARTDEVGEFRIRAVEPGSYRALVRRIGYAAGARNVAVAGDMDDLSIELAPVPQSLREVRVRGKGSGIFGQIGNAHDLAPIAGATVYVAGTRDSAATDSVGAYFVAVERPGRYMVRVRAPGFDDQMFLVEVKRDEVADGSRLLDAGESRHIPAIAWADFDQRLNWRTRNGAALLSGSDVRRAGSSTTGGLKASGVMVARGLRLGSTVCIFVNGQARPGYILDAIPPEEITAVEAYSGRGEPAKLLSADWPRGGRCSETGERPLRGGGVVSYLVIWTR